ncbi:MAG: hypothetical protein ACFB5Z_05390 [Elainellaceae cyanobacterium]
MLLQGPYSAIAGLNLAKIIFDSPMNPDTLTETIQKGFRVTLGAASFLAETLQNSQKRDQNLDKLRVENLSELSEEWAVEGAQKEQEARNFVESVIGQSTSAGPSASSGPNGPAMPTVPTNSASEGGPSAGGVPVNIQMELDLLKSQLIEIRLELEKANQGDGVE